MTIEVDGQPKIYEAETGVYAVSVFSAAGATFCGALACARQLASLYAIPKPLTLVTPLQPGRYLVAVTTTCRSSNEPDDSHCAVFDESGANHECGGDILVAVDAVVRH